ncbi:hypothetical protein MLD38_012970 [Melastoma candidum]|uniref:Uncharacterized protein n=1 Tax=Melastoma candidum TaxID=119954 RepID=A0ACB9R9W8_9MYRT|nr:hypothetical protein MLD38_012970 [Melastoma candidum]
MLCACSGEQFQFEEPAKSPESLATRDFSLSGLSSSRTRGEWEARLDDAPVDEAESTLKEALSLNYEEARALLGRLEYQRGNYDAALQVFQGIDIRGLTPRMIKAIAEQVKPRKVRPKANGAAAGVMSMHSVSLLFEAILLKARSLEGLGRFVEAAKECKIIVDVVESALPNGMAGLVGEHCKMQEVFHKALELVPDLWIKAGILDEAITAYRRVLVKPWNLHSQKLADVQKSLASILLFGGLEAGFSPPLCSCSPNMPKSNMEEAVLLLLILGKKMASGEISWDADVMDHLSYALSIIGMFELLADHYLQVLPGTYNRSERWYTLALCYVAAGQNDIALDLLKKISGCSKAQKLHIPSLLLGAKLCSQDMKLSSDGAKFSIEAIEADDSQTKHFFIESHKYLGICYGNEARMSISDSRRVMLQEASMNALRSAAQRGKEDPEVIYSLAMENALQRNLSEALENAIFYSDMEAGSSGKGWKLMSLILSAEQRLQDAEKFVDLALDEVEGLDQLDILRLKASLQATQENPKQAIETYRILLAIIHDRREMEAKKSGQLRDSPIEVLAARDLETSAWQDLALVYAKLGAWEDADICLDKAKSLGRYSPQSWYTAGLVLQVKSLHKEALVPFSIALSLNPDHVPSLISTAEELMEHDPSSLPIARSFLMNALRLEPTNHKGWFNLGLLSKMEGSPQQAAEFFQAAYELEVSAPIQNFV